MREDGQILLAPSIAKANVMSLFSVNDRELVCGALREFKLVWAAIHSDLGTLLKDLRNDAGFQIFVSDVFDGREEYGSASGFKNRRVSDLFAVQFDSLLTIIGGVFEEWLKNIGSEFDTAADGHSRVFDQCLLVLEGLLNASLLRYRDEKMPSAGFSAMAVYVGCPITYSSARFRLSVCSSGIAVGLKKSDNGEQTPSSRRCALVSGREFVFSRPFLAPSSYLLGVAPSDGLLQSICPALPVQRGRSHPKSDEGLLLLRLIQREACLLTEEWEFKNAVLAVDYTSARNALSRQVATQDVPIDRSSKTPGAAVSLLADVLQRRDELGLWYAATLADLQNYVLDRCGFAAPAVSGCGAFPAAETADTKQELEAARQVLLAALQKLYLPASVSRHDYDPAVFAQAARFVRDQVRFAPDDIAAQLSFLALGCATGSVHGDFENRCLDLIRYLEHEVPINWLLSFDPSPSIKAVSWMIPPSQYFSIILCFALALARKSLRGGARLDEDWSAVLVSLLQMPDSFPQIRDPSIDRRGDDCRVEALEGTLQRLCGESMNWISNARAEGMSDSYRIYWSQLTQQRLQSLVGVRS